MREPCTSKLDVYRSPYVPWEADMKPPEAEWKMVWPSLVRWSVCTFSCTDMLWPTRATFRRLTDEPMSTKPITDTADPKRANERKDNVLPIWLKSSTENEDPSLEYDLRDSEAPKCA
mmetsp:Transcript_149739/g.264806  ORF Transcript_149739/g.264806 Transcript_149739/m.264806 type:complete len:117 (-) Transcript_149739:562-912(-)